MEHWAEEMWESARQERENLPQQERRAKQIAAERCHRHCWRTWTTHLPSW